MNDVESVWAIWTSGIIALLAFLTTVSEKLQKLLGPVGRWIGRRRQRAMERQTEFEILLEKRHDAQVAALLDEIELYRQRYATLVKDMEYLQEQNRRQAIRINQLERKVLGHGESGAD